MNSKPLLGPQYLIEALTHSPEYERACQLLWLNWNEDPNALYRHPVEPEDVRFARALQDSQLVRGRLDLGNYRDVSQLLAHHGRWFSNNGRDELLAPFAG
ncbi:hypothetical protein [Limosilactobacillus secaliphilus]|uniref:Uncharacterized protein n=1 Tax=Limosilactobacillus secaliphilus TaxID=396268 RepID=A0A0R2I4K7_9LACO|nr:hypothetical protein [Limosilactobacillus secaliphilus]KRN58518.1 hypothetical protein IV45_GL000968 [Limosilactobacillus secaliphilus]